MKSEMKRIQKENERISGISASGAQQQLAENGPRVSLSMESVMLRNSNGKCRVLGVSGAGAQQQLTEN